MSSLPIPSLLLALSALSCAGGGAVVTQVTPLRHVAVPSELTLVTPAESTEVLGAVFDGDGPGPRRTLDLSLQVRTNPCAEFLLETSDEEPVRALDLWPLDDVWIPALGLQAATPMSTHLLVHLESARALRVEPGPGYASCCSEEDCGDGFVSAVHEGDLEVHPATTFLSAVPPIVLLSDDGRNVGLGLHDGASVHGVVAVELSRP